MPALKEKMVNQYSLKTHALILSTVTLTIIIYQNYAGLHLISSRAGIRPHAKYFYDSLFEMLWLLLLFSFLLRINLNVKTKKLIGRLAPLTMGIYIVHIELRDIITKVIEINSFEKALLFWLLVIFLSGTVSFLINRTLFRKYLLEI